MRSALWDRCACAAGLGLPSSLGPGGGSGAWIGEVQKQLGSREA